MSKFSVEALRRRLVQQPLWYAPRQHVWLQCHPTGRTSSSTCAPDFSSATTSTAASGNVKWRVQWGLTEQGMDRLGDVTHLTSLLHPNDFVQQNQDLLRVHWEGYEWTEADELYHTIWESVEGVETIASPVSGKVTNVVNNNDGSVIDEDLTWVELECDEEHVLEAAADWVDDTSYHRWVKTQAPSKFSDQVA